MPQQCRSAQLSGRAFVVARIHDLVAARFAPLLLLLLSLATGSAWAQGSFDFAAVEAQAQKLASQPYKDVQPIGGEMKKLGYDQYRALRRKPETALVARQADCSASSSFRRASSTTGR